MTSNSADNVNGALKSCPFCGGEARRVDIEHDDGFENQGGSCIACTICNASSNVQFGFKENLVSDWNTRATSTPASEAEVLRKQGQGEGKAAVLGWLRERSAMKPPATLWHAAQLLADQFEATERPASALPATKEAGHD